MQGVTSSLIARNESWVRMQAHALARRLPSNVEKADLIQAGLIAVAQAALGFDWPGDHASKEGMEAFVRYARLRVKGAMIDELRQFDHLSRGQRRRVKVVQIARERWRAIHGTTPTLAHLSAVCGIDVDEIARLEQAALSAQTESLTEDEGDDVRHAQRHPATAQDEVEARVDTAILMRRLETFFAQLPPREQQVIDSYLGVGLAPHALAEELGVSPSRISQIYKGACRRIAAHFDPVDPDTKADRAADRKGDKGVRLEELIKAREAHLAEVPAEGPWGELVEFALTRPPEDFDVEVDDR
jgi:RNA polymerase sigma factor for flagellar operon FliA